MRIGTWFVLMMAAVPNVAWADAVRAHHRTK